jgi:hypothetical protein
MVREVSSTNQVFDRIALTAALTDLSTRLGELNINGEIVIVGGAYMALAHDTRRLTRDVDALVISSDLIISAAEDVAAVRGLPLDWLNDTVSAFFSAHPEAIAPAYSVLLSLPHLTVSSPPLEYVLAMKVMSARGDPRRDFQDAVTLIQKMNPQPTNLQELQIGITDHVGKITPMSTAFLSEAFQMATALPANSTLELEQHTHESSENER